MLKLFIVLLRADRPPLLPGPGHSQLLPSPLSSFTHMKSHCVAGFATMLRSQLSMTNKESSTVCWTTLGITFIERLSITTQNILALSLPSLFMRSWRKVTSTAQKGRAVQYNTLFFWRSFLELILHNITHLTHPLNAPYFVMLSTTEMPLRNLHYAKIPRQA